VSIEGESGEQLTFAREVQWDPVREDILHVDFFVVTANQKVISQVPLVLTGESAGARQAGGTVALQMRELTVEALPLEIPSEIEVNIDRLVESTDVVRAGEISIPGNVAIVTDSEEVVARIEVNRTSQPGADAQSTGGSPEAG
jgi:large subunit ribosomal protein L25